MWYEKKILAGLFIHSYILCCCSGSGFCPSMHQGKGGDPPCTGRQSITVWTHSAVLCVKRKLSVDPCWPSVYSAESGPISLGINAQHGTSILPAVQRPRNSLSQPLPFTVPCPLSVSLRHSQKDSISPPLVTLPSLCSNCCWQVHYCVSCCPTGGSRSAPPWHKDSDDDKRSIRRKQYRRRRRRTTDLDLKKQQLRQPHCHSNICFMLSAAAGQFTAWEPHNSCRFASLLVAFCILSSKDRFV